MSVPVFELEFDCSGQVFDPAALKNVVDVISRTGITDLFVFAHGWNNDKADAKQLYDQFFANLDRILVAQPVPDRVFAALAIYWPSKRFTDEELIPGGGAAGVDDPVVDSVNLTLLSRLENDPVRLGGNDPNPVRVKLVEQARALLPQVYAESGDARREFVLLLRSMLDASEAHADDASIEFFTEDATKIFAAFAGAAPAPAAAPPAGGAPISPDDVGGSGGAAASFLGDLLEGPRNAVRRLLNFTTYYTMKQRAGVVGRTGVAPVIEQLRAAFPRLRQHLVGHSFGGRLVTAAADALREGTRVDSLTLLQAAYSHNGLSLKWDGTHDGAFADVLTRGVVSGPISITYTKNDKAVGIAYPLASRLAHDQAAALGDENDPYGGMGRNGAQHLDVLKAALAPGHPPFTFSPGRVHNFEGSTCITGHGDVTNGDVVWLVLQAVLSAGGRVPPAGTREPAGRAASVDEPNESFTPGTAPAPPRSPAGGAPPASPLPGLDPDRSKSWEFTPGSLDRSVIALPLLDIIRAETDPSRLHAVIIDLNLDFPGGRRRARESIELMVGQALQQLGGALPREGVCKVKSDLSEQYVFAELRTEAIKRLARSDEERTRGGGTGSTVPAQRAIYHIWPDFDVKPLISKSIATVKADAARNAFSALGEGIVWAVLDSGIDGTHPHFQRHQNLELDREAGSEGALAHRDFTVLDPADERPLYDAFGHGTHVAGIIAGELTSEGGGAIEADCRYRDEHGDVQQTTLRLERISGMAPRAKLVSLKILDDSGVDRGASEPTGRVSNIIAALEYVQQINGHGRRIRIHGINLSVGYEFEPRWFACGRSPLCVEVDRLVRSGVVVVTAAGNTGYAKTVVGDRSVASGMDLTINDPGNAELAITVGATHREAPHTYGVSYFSSKGPTGDGRLKPDLVAPGEKIVSADSAQRRQRQAGAPQPGAANGDGSVAKYREDSGTSMAAPHVSGVIAAFLSIRQEFQGQPEAVKEIFCNSAVDLKRERYFQGAGLVDLMKAIQSV